MVLQLVNKKRLEHSIILHKAIINGSRRNHLYEFWLNQLQMEPSETVPGWNQDFTKNHERLCNEYKLENRMKF